MEGGPKTTAEALSRLGAQVETADALWKDVLKAAGPLIEEMSEDLGAARGTTDAQRDRDAAIVAVAVDAKALGKSIAEMLTGLGYRGAPLAALRPKLARHWIIAKAVDNGRVSLANAQSIIRSPERGAGGLGGCVKHIEALTSPKSGVTLASEALRDAARVLAPIVHGQENKAGETIFSVGNVRHALLLADNTGTRATLSYLVSSVALMLAASGTEVAEAAEVAEVAAR